MSRLQGRKERDCLNCGTEVQGRFCHFCGQENLEPKESVWHLITHFFQDITHFDGKFFSTLKYLMLRPGFLSKEYMKGRRVSYVNPIRMYIFTSAFFFLIFFNIFTFNKEKVDKNITIQKKTYTLLQIEKMDSAAFAEFTKEVNKEAGRKAVPMSRVDFKNYVDTAYEKMTIQLPGDAYKSIAAYDSALSSGAIKHNWVQRKFFKKGIEINEKYRNNGGQLFNDFANILLHSLPQMFFILLPIFALFLKILYYRRKEYYYVNHGIFSLHFYIFSFITMLFLFALSSLNSYLHWSFINVLVTIIGIGIFFYLYKAMRKFYMQRRAKTILKFLILCFLLLFTILILFMVFVFFSAFKL